MLWQSIQSQHGQNGGYPGTQDGTFEDDGYKRRPTEVGTSTNIQRVFHDRHPILKHKSTEAAG